MAIQVGLEDLDRGDAARARSAVRNLHARVLLLLKQRLVELSPEDSDEVLLKQRVLPVKVNDGSVEFVGKGTKTVDVHAIRERFKSLGIDVEWKRFEHFNTERNKIEHYDSDIGTDALRGLASDVLVVIRDFVVRELDRDPRDLFGDETWEKLLNNEEVFSAEQKQCSDALASVTWPTNTFVRCISAITCHLCLSPLVLPVEREAPSDEPSLACRSCGEEMSFDDFADEAVRSTFPYDEQGTRWGETDPLGVCPGCDRHTYVLESRECAICDYEPPYTECIRCGEELDLDEQESGICGYCWHMTQKDD